VQKRKAVVSFVVIAVLLLAIGLTLTPNSAAVSSKQWTGLDHPMGVAIGDYDNDGLNDIAIAEDAIGGRVTVYKSDGTTVIKQWTGIDYPQYVSIGDYDNDGLNDLAFSERDGPGNGKVTVYKSDGTTIIRQWTGIYTCPEGVAIGDYDNDGLNEIAFTDAPVTYEGRVRVFKSDGTLIAQWTNHYGPWGVAIGDYDNDGLNDIAFEESYNGKVFVYKSDGTTVIKQWTGLGGPAGVAIGDYDNDGLNDIAITEVSVAGLIGRVTVYKSDGTTVIRQWTVPINMNSGPMGVAIGDYNNDGLNDLAFSEYDAGRVTVYYQTNYVSVYPKMITGPPPKIGETFDVNITIANVEDLYTWQAGMTFNASVLECVSIAEGEFLKRAGATTLWTPGSINNDTGTISYSGCSRTGVASGVSGTGQLMRITFKVKGNGNSTLHLTDVLLLDSDLVSITPVTIVDGHVEIHEQDISILSLTKSAAEAYPTWIVPFNVTVVVENQGTRTETFNVTAYASAIEIGRQEITLAAGANTTLEFNWNLAGIAEGTYTIRAEADVLYGEIDTADNTKIDGTVKIKHPGDANDDTIVNAYDLGILAKAWTASGGTYDARADFNGDETIDTLDHDILKAYWP